MGYTGNRASVCGCVWRPPNDVMMKILGTDGLGADFTPDPEVERTKCSLGHASRPFFPSQAVKKLQTIDRWVVTQRCGHQALMFFLRNEECAVK